MYTQCTVYNALSYAFVLSPRVVFIPIEEELQQDLARYIRLKAGSSLLEARSTKSTTGTIRVILYLIQYVQSPNFQCVSGALRCSALSACF